MDPFLFTLVLGFAGLAFMAMAGLHHGHGGHDVHVHGHDVGDVSLHHGGHAHAVPGHTGAAHAGHLPAHGGHHAGHAHETAPARGHAWDVPRRAGGAALGLLSPRVMSSLLLGFGATGMLVSAWLDGMLQVLAALAGAATLEWGVIKPMWGFLAAFASPARTLESALMEPAQAVTSFNADGQGLVALEVDGQITQILGTLRPADRQLGVRVRAGDRLLVEEVDGARNRCVVSYLGSRS